jgi:hypothetical protein
LELLEDGTAYVGKVVGRCPHTLSHILQLGFVSFAVNFIPNKQSPALSLLVDCPMLFGIKGLLECGQLLELLEDSTAYVGKVVGRCLYTLSCTWCFQLVDLFSQWKKYDSNAWVLFQVKMSTLASIFQWLHDQQAAKYIH